MLKNGNPTDKVVPGPVGETEFPQHLIEHARTIPTAPDVLDKGVTQDTYCEAGSFSKNAQLDESTSTSMTRGHLSYYTSSMPTPTPGIQAGFMPTAKLKFPTFTGAEDTFMDMIDMEKAFPSGSRCTSR